MRWQSSEDSFLSFTPRSRPTRPPRRRGLTPGARTPWLVPRQSTAFPSTEMKPIKSAWARSKESVGVLEQKQIKEDLSISPIL